MAEYQILHPDAPPVPDGCRPKPGVEYGCGRPDCHDCYTQIRVDEKHRAELAELRQATKEPISGQKD